MKISEAGLIFRAGLSEQNVLCGPQEPDKFIWGEINQAA